MTKIITNKGKEINIKYYEIEKYCIKEILINEDYIKEFNEYKKNYNYFNAFFDFIFHKKNYILYEPLLIPNTFLYNKDNWYHIIEDENKLNNKDYDFTLMNDKYTSIVKYPIEINEGFFILTDGTLLTNNYVERHLKSAKLLLNNYLIQSPTIYKEYLKFIEKKGKYFTYYIIDFLIENVGIINGKRYGKNIHLISNNNIITKEQLNTIKNIKKYFYVYEENYNNYNIKKMTYRNR